MFGVRRLDGAFIRLNERAKTKESGVKPPHSKKLARLHRKFLNGKMRWP